MKLKSGRWLSATERKRGRKIGVRTKAFTREQIGTFCPNAPDVESMEEPMDMFREKRAKRV